MERILCAAIWYKDWPKMAYHSVANIDKGVVLCGHRHGHIIGQISALLDKKQWEMGKSEQGFLTSKNRFLNREEARELHIKNGGTAKFEELYSEDLY